MSSILDPVNDKNLTVFHRLVNLYEMPDFVKTASSNTIDEEEVKTLPSSAFADPVYRQFPCHTKAATYLSYAYFLNGANRLTKWASSTINQRMQDFIDHWGIRYECDHLKTGMDKQASADAAELPDDCYAMVENYGGNVIRRLPMVNSETVKTAAAFLFENRDKFPYPWRKNAARKILKKACDFNTPIEAAHSEYINKCAGFGVGSTAKIAKALYDRAVLMNGSQNLRNSGMQERLVKAAKALVTMEAPTHETFTKTAEFIATVDSAAEFYKLYKRGLPSPEEVVFELTEKRASELKNTCVQLTTGTAYRKVDIEKAAFEPFKLMGDDMVEEMKDAFGSFDLEKAATILPTLPRNDAAVYEKGMKLLGIKNESQIRKDAGLPSNSVDWSPDDWRNFIEGHGHKAETTDFQFTIKLKHPQNAQ